jgi:hypothetical protein|tara:strand:+ start:2565 stop:2816 length:252 start_codon:yes stop_codon:yes gene_type:complete
MEYIVILALSFVDNLDLEFYNYRNVKFNNLETCETFVNSKKKYLNDTIQLQFNQKNRLKSYVISCWTSEEWNKYLDSIFKIDT